MQRIRTALEKNKGATIVAVLLLAIGFIAGASPKIGEPIIEEAEKTDTSTFAYVDKTAVTIFANNFIIAMICTIGGFILLPTLYYSIFRVGVVYGALASHMSPADFFIILGAFALLELLAIFFSVTGGLLFPKYLASKILGYPADLRETLFQTFFFLIIAGVLLVPAAILEAYLLYATYFEPSMVLGVLASGFLITFAVIYLLLR